MIILDTNVISEPLRPRPAQEVIDWLDAQAVETLYLTTISLAEIRFGIAALAKGRRKSTLTSRFDNEVLPLFDGRILSFDVDAADTSGKLRARARTHGSPLGAFDSLIASIAAARDFAVATRDTEPFIRAGLKVVNPFEPR